MKKHDLQTQLEMLRLGIIPQTHRNKFMESFSALSFDERRRAARKFRKLWRKLVKRFPKDFGVDSTTPLCGRDFKPDYVMRDRRRLYVYSHLRNDIIKRGDTK